MEKTLQVIYILFALITAVSGESSIDDDEELKKMKPIVFIDSFIPLTNITEHLDKDAAETVVPTAEVMSSTRPEEGVETARIPDSRNTTLISIPKFSYTESEYEDLEEKSNITESFTSTEHKTETNSSTMSSTMRVVFVNVTKPMLVEESTTVVNTIITEVESIDLEENTPSAHTFADTDFSEEIKPTGETSSIASRDELITLDTEITETYTTTFPTMKNTTKEGKDEFITPDSGLGETISNIIDVATTLSYGTIDNDGETDVSSSPSDASSIGTKSDGYFLIIASLLLGLSLALIIVWICCLLCRLFRKRGSYPVQRCHENVEVGFVYKNVGYEAS